MGQTVEQRREAAGIPKIAEHLDANLLLCIVRHFVLIGSAPTWADMCRASGSGRQLTAQKIRALRDARPDRLEPRVGSQRHDAPNLRRSPI